MAGQQRHLRFAWWNLHNFAHYDPDRRIDPRRLKSQAAYDLKRGRVLAALHELFASDYPDVLAVCEITRAAAVDLRSQLPGDYTLTIAPTDSRDDRFQVAVFARSPAGFTSEPPLLPADIDVPEEARPMPVVHYPLPGHLIRFVACHWTGLGEDTSGEHRGRLADFLRGNTYEFLYPEVERTGTVRHVVILGDLNEEPFAPLFEHRLSGARDRASSRRTHWRDERIRRVRLYNAAWKYLGEQTRHGAPDAASPDVAGTFYSPRSGWRTFDHLLVTGGLLGSNPPFLDESRTRIMTTPAMRNAAGRPIPYDAEHPERGGVSDHLPIVGRITLPEEHR